MSTGTTSPATPNDDLYRLWTRIDTNIANFTFTEPIDVIATKLADVHAGYFNDQSDPNGTPWKPLSPVTVKRKGHPVILIETNRMRQSVVNRQDGQHVERLTRNSLDWGTSDEKAGWHQSGTEHMPQRQFVGWNEPAIDFACNQIADSAVNQLLAGIGTP